MGHADVDNLTPFAFAPFFAADEEGRPLYVLLVCATYALLDDRLALLAPQTAPPLAGLLHGAPGESSYKLEPETAWVKPATDVVLVAHAHAPTRGATEMDVAIKVGPVEKRARVVGDRTWVKSMGSITMTRPQPFERVPLRYENAFGGKDRSAGAPERPRIDRRNPVGVGYRAPDGAFEEGLRLPNVEAPTAMIDRYGDAPAAVGFGFVSPDWEPRASLAGVFDSAWEAQRFPLLPVTFDRRFFNGASAGMVAPGYLRGDEAVSLRGVSRQNESRFQLPMAAPLGATVALHRQKDKAVSLSLDTVVIDTDDDQVHLRWRAAVALRDGAHDVQAVRVESLRG